MKLDTKHQENEILKLPTLFSFSLQKQRLLVI